MGEWVRWLMPIVVGAAALGGTANSTRVLASSAAVTPADPATHVTTGVVTFASDTRLVIARRGKGRRDLTFAVDRATVRGGTIAAGAVVSVRYRVNDGALIATAITVRARNRLSSGETRSQLDR